MWSQPFVLYMAFLVNTEKQTANICALLLLSAFYWVTTMPSESQGCVQLPIRRSFSHSDKANAQSRESGDREGATKAGDIQLKRKDITNANNVRALYTSRTSRPRSVKC